MFNPMPMWSFLYSPLLYILRARCKNVRGNNVRGKNVRGNNVRRVNVRGKNVR